MASRFHFEHEMPSSIFTEEDLVDDSMGVIPMNSLKTPHSLRSRFIARLERLFNAKVKMEESTVQRSIVITLTGKLKVGQIRLESQKDVRTFLSAIENLLSLIGKSTTREGACAQLRDELLFYTYDTSKQIIENMEQIFRGSEKIYDDLVSRMFGIDNIDAGDSTMDRELGDQLISLYQKVKAYDYSMRETNSLIEFASQITRVIMHLQDRLRGLLGRARFAGEMYRLICDLGFPERMYSTLIRAAASSKTFEKVTFLLPVVTLSKRVSFESPTGSPSSVPRKFVPQKKPTLPPTPSPSPPFRQKDMKHPRFSTNTSPLPARLGNNGLLQVATRNASLGPPQPAALITLSPNPPLPEKSKRLMRFESAGSSSPVQINNDDLLEAARPYLPLSDRTLSVLSLAPVSNQITAQLIATVLRSAILPVESEAWYQFGFAATKDEAEERHLAGLYATILKEARNPGTIFRELVEAVELNGLVRLFDMKEYGHFRQAFPRLELFLRTPPTKRSTVWRLKQFVRSDQDVEPPACLQRDFGFKFCRHREEVDRMKAVYTDMLHKIDPLVIHGYCIVNRIYEEGIVKTGIAMSAKDARLMKNDYPSPFLGFDNDLGLAAYRGAFFKRPMKM